jgi:hypothetical protein
MNILDLPEDLLLVVLLQLPPQDLLSLSEARLILSSINPC